MRPLTTQHGRDLEWVLTSPPLLFHSTVVDARWGELQLARHQGLAARLDQDGSELAKAIRRMNGNQLGDYFETLMVTWLKYVGEAKLLAANLQINGGGGTVGEFDLLFRRDRRVHHWELAVKFYLGYPGPSGPIWYGPNPKDILREKWRKMRKKQLRLSEHPAAEPALRQLRIRAPVDTAAYIRGYLYEALDPQFSTHHHPHANRDGLRGWWVHRGAVETHLDALPDEVVWLRLPKLRWLASARPAGDRLGALPDVLAPLPEDLPQHVAAVRQTDTGYVEVSRGFVVPDGWPHS